MKRIGIFSQLVPPKPHWTGDNIPDQTGKTALITGGDSGIGKETARVLLLKGANVYITSKSGASARTTIDELKREAQRDTIFFLRLDLTDLDSVKSAADEFIGKEQVLHTLYNNDQGHEILFGTNVLAHFYLTKLLLPVLKATAEKSPPGTVRVINVSSISHYMAAAEGIRWSTLGSGEEARVARSKLGSTRLNGQSKLGTILFSNQLAEKCRSDGIVSISLFPGALNADIGGHAGVFLHRVKQLIVAAICLAISGGNFASLTGDLTADRIRTNVVGTVNSRIQAGVAQASPTLPPTPAPAAAPAAAAAAAVSDPLSSAQQQLSAAQDHLTDFSNASLRALTSLFAGTSVEAGSLSGKYLTAWARVTLPHRKALLNNEIGVKLWEWCEARIKEHEKSMANQVTRQATNPGSAPAESQAPKGAAECSDPKGTAEAECADTKGTKEIEEVKEVKGTKEAEIKEVKDAKDTKEAEEIKEKS
ncbi:hypothetical protein BC826DRAFT_1024237 [Russula brevipes]|nr:hypothetical protein BC826DRAFT_1024237 [Russula brevipes]